jgi:hypothetical protein
VLVAEAWGASEGIEGGRLLRIVLLVVVIWGVASSYQLLERSDAASAARSLLGHDPSYGATPLRGIVTSRDRILSEDPYVPVSRGQDPVVLDPFMFLRIASHHPAWRDAFIRRIDAHEFTKVILMRKLVPTDPWWSTQHFGPQVARAIARDYRLQRTAPRYYHPNEPDQGTYYVYVPRS